jgi:Zn-dependent protease
MDFINSGIHIGTYRGIDVRLHFTFLLFAFYRAASFGHIGFGIAFVVGLYGCILLHEFGHALAARWCDGECDLIVLWPLGGLAFARPAFHPTAHLITTVAGPFVTLVLWLMFAGLERLIVTAFPQPYGSVPYAYWFVATMAELNRWLLIFNLIPAFPMDGGRMLRDTIWHWMSAEKATRIAVLLSKVIASAGVVYALWAGQYWLILLAAFILFQSSSEKAVVGSEALGTYQFSLRERWSRGSRRRQFHRGVAARQREAETAAFHRCTACGLTDRDEPAMEFRVCPECSAGQEYCRAHLDSHPHV